MMDYANGNGTTDGGAETVVNIPQNRTLMLEQLTQEAPLRPIAVYGLETLKQVFDYYQPEAEIAFINADGVTKREILHFTSVDDFSVQRIARQSVFLSDLQFRKQESLRILTQLRTNKNLQAALANNGARKSLLNAVNSMIAELNSNL